MVADDSAGRTPGWRESIRRWVGSQIWTGKQVAASDPGEVLPDVSFSYPGGENAVLLIHGLTGTPTEMRLVGKGLAAAGFTVHGVQLAGHCGSEAALLRTGWRDWYQSVEEAYHRLARLHPMVFVAGLSMGALLSLHLAASRPPRLGGVGCYSTTLWYDGWAIPRLSFLMPLLLSFPLGDRYRFVENFPYGIKDERLRERVVASMTAGCSDLAGNLGLTGSSLRELRQLVRLVKGEMPNIVTPTLVIHAQEDDLTSTSNADYLERRLGGPVRKVLLDDSYHMITVDRQHREVVRESAAFFHALAAGGVAEAP